MGLRREPFTSVSRNDAVPKPEISQTAGASKTHKPKTRLPSWSFHRLRSTILIQRLRAREIITSHFRIPSSGHLGPIFTRKILSVGFATPAVLLHQIDPI